MLARILFLVAAVGGLLAQDVEIRPRFVTGDEIKLEIARILDETLRPEANYRSTTMVRIRVVSANANGSVLDWQIGDTVVRGAPAGPDAKKALATQAINNLAFRLALDADGRFDRLINAVDLAPKLEAARDRLLALLRQSLPLQERPAVDAMTASLTAGDMAGLVVYEAQIYSDMHGLSQKVGLTRETTVSRTSPLSGKPVPARCLVRIESATPDDATVVRTTTLDTEALNATMPEELKRVNAAAVAAGMAPRRFALSEESQYVFARRLGLIREASLDVIATSGPDRRLERLVMRMVEPPKR